MQTWPGGRAQPIIRTPGMYRSSRRFSLVMLLALLLSTVSMVGSGATPAVPASRIPAPTPGIRPTIAVSPASGYAGQTIAVSGKGVAPYPGVRVAWLAGDATRTTAVVDLDGSGAYSASIVVPDDLSPGPAEICATVTGTAEAEFQCTSFTVETPPPGTIVGKIPVTAQQATNAPQAPAAKFNVYSHSGTIIASTPISSDGSFSLDVAPGAYKTGVTGLVSRLITTSSVHVEARGMQELVTMFSSCTSVARVVEVRASPSDMRTGGPADFGTFLALGSSGSVVNVTFEADVQIVDAEQFDGVSFRIGKPDGTTLNLGTDTSAPYQATYNVSLLPAGISGLRVEPINAGERNSLCGEHRRIEVLEDPMKSPIVQPTTGRTTWDSTRNRYNFRGTLPNLGGLLPITFPNPTLELPLVGPIESRLDAGVRLEGSMALNGDIRMQIVTAEILTRVFNRTVFNRSRDLLMPGAERLAVNPDNLRRVGFDLGPYNLLRFNEEVPVFHGVLASYWGIVTVNASVSVGISGDLVLSAMIRPLVPAVDATLRATVRPRLSVSIWIDILLGVASAGADADAQASLGLPLRINTENRDPVWLDSPCLGIRVTLSVWARVNLLFWDERWNLDPFDLVNRQFPPGCDTTYALADRRQASNVAPPRVMASPTVASGPGGEMIAAYVEDVTPGQITPTMKIMARFWDAGKHDWGPAMPVSDGKHAVQDPSAAFFYASDTDKSATPMVVWTETVATIEQEQAAGGDLGKILSYQEIFYATWDGVRWNVKRLTNDLLPDGRASIDGDWSGATLAWVHDPDANPKTRNEVIAVRQWDKAVDMFLPAEYLDGSAVGGDPSAEGLNVQVDVAHSSSPMLAWTYDNDRDINTNGDRGIIIARYQKDVWQMQRPKAFPAGSHSPSIAVDPQLGPRVAFLWPAKDADGSDSGIGNQAELWQASWSPASGWRAAPVLDQQQPVRAERPRLEIGPQGEALLLFRRFGEVGTNGEMGQLALTRLDSSGIIGPQYLTDEVRQHWQPALAINPATSQAMVLNVSRAAIGADVAPGMARSYFKPAASAGPLAVQRAQLSAGDNPVESLLLEATADPALDPELQLSQLHAAPQSTVQVTATVRNLGRGPSGTLTVRLYQGQPGSGTPIGDPLVISEPLEFNEWRQVVFDVIASGGDQPIYAEVTTDGENTSLANDRASGNLGTLVAPTMVSVAVSTLYESALEVGWMPPQIDGVLGYRILRGESPSGPYELVGEAAGTTYHDLLLQRGRTYYYVVQAYDSSGHLSPNSDEASGLLPLKSALLPMVRR